MQRTIEASIKIDDGLHKGVIKSIFERTEPFEYIDIGIEFEEGKTLIASYPDKLTPDTAFGQLLERFGTNLAAVGDQIDPEHILLKMTCQFQTIKEKGKDGKEYSNIVRESVKPVE